MKKCTWCGKEYSDDASICAIDQSPLVSDPPALPVPESQPETGSAPPEEPAVQDGNELQPDSPNLSDEESGAGDGFISLGQFDPFEAARLLRRFETDGIQFRIDQVDRSIMSARGARRADLIEIYVQQVDREKANSILTEDWKV